MRERKTYNAKPVMRRKIAISGKVVSSRFRLPKVSIVYTAGKAKTKLMHPKPKEANRACVSEKRASVKMFDFVVIRGQHFVGDEKKGTTYRVVRNNVDTTY